MRKKVKHLFASKRAVLLIAIISAFVLTAGGVFAAVLPSLSGNNGNSLSATPTNVASDAMTAQKDSILGTGTDLTSAKIRINTESGTTDSTITRTMYFAGHPFYVVNRGTQDEEDCVLLFSKDGTTAIAWSTDTNIDKYEGSNIQRYLSATDKDCLYVDWFKGTRDYEYTLPKEVSVESIEHSSDTDLTYTYYTTATNQKFFPLGIQPSYSTKWETTAPAPYAGCGVSDVESTKSTIPYNKSYISNNDGIWTRTLAKLSSGAEAYYVWDDGLVYKQGESRLAVDKTLKVQFSTYIPTSKILTLSYLTATGTELTKYGDGTGNYYNSDDSAYPYVRMTVANDDIAPDVTVTDTDIVRYDGTEANEGGIAFKLADDSKSLETGEYLMAYVSYGNYSAYLPLTATGTNFSISKKTLQDNGITGGLTYDDHDLELTILVCQDAGEGTGATRMARVLGTFNNINHLKSSYYISQINVGAAKETYEGTTLNKVEVTDVANSLDNDFNKGKYNEQNYALTLAYDYNQLAFGANYNSDTFEAVWYDYDDASTTTSTDTPPASPTSIQKESFISYKSKNNIQVDNLYYKKNLATGTTFSYADYAKTNDAGDIVYADADKWNYGVTNGARDGRYIEVSADTTKTYYYFMQFTPKTGSPASAICGTDGILYRFAYTHLANKESLETSLESLDVLLGEASIKKTSGVKDIQCKIDNTDGKHTYRTGNTITLKLKFEAKTDTKKSGDKYQYKFSSVNVYNKDDTSEKMYNIVYYNSSDVPTTTDIDKVKAEGYIDVTVGDDLDINLEPDIWYLERTEKEEGSGKGRTKVDFGKQGLILNYDKYVELSSLNVNLDKASNDESSLDLIKNDLEAYPEEYDIGENYDRSKNEQNVQVSYYASNMDFDLVFPTGSKTGAIQAVEMQYVVGLGTPETIGTFYADKDKSTTDTTLHTSDKFGDSNRYDLQNLKEDNKFYYYLVLTPNTSEGSGTYSGKYCKNTIMINVTRQAVSALPSTTEADYKIDISEKSVNNKAAKSVTKTQDDPKNFENYYSVAFDVTDITNEDYDKRYESTMTFNVANAEGTFIGYKRAEDTSYKSLVRSSSTVSIKDSVAEGKTSFDMIYKTKGCTTSLNSISVQRTMRARLEGLKIDDSEVSIEFAENTFEYSLEVDWDYSQIDFIPYFNSADIQTCTMYDWVTATNVTGTSLGEIKSGASSKGFTRDSEHLDLPDVTVYYRLHITPSTSAYDDSYWRETDYIIAVTSLSKSMFKNVVIKTTDPEATATATATTLDPPYKSNLDEQMDSYYDYTCNINPGTNAAYTDVTDIELELFDDDVKGLTTLEQLEQRLVLTFTIDNLGVSISDKVVGYELVDGSLTKIKVTLTDDMKKALTLYPGKAQCELTCKFLEYGSLVKRYPETYTFDIEYKPNSVESSLTDGKYFAQTATSTNIELSFAPEYDIKIDGVTKKEVVILYTTDGTDPAIDLEGDLSSSTYKYDKENGVVKDSSSTILNLKACTAVCNNDSGKIELLGDIKSWNYEFSVLPKPVNRNTSYDKGERIVCYNVCTDTEFLEYQMYLPVSDSYSGGAKLYYEIKADGKDKGLVLYAESAGDLQISLSQIRDELGDSFYSGKATVKIYSYCEYVEKGETKYMKSLECYTETVQFHQGVIPPGLTIGTGTYYVENDRIEPIVTDTQMGKIEYSTIEYRFNGGNEIVTDTSFVSCNIGSAITLPKNMAKENMITLEIKATTVSPVSGNTVTGSNTYQYTFATVPGVYVGIENSGALEELTQDDQRGGEKWYYYNDQTVWVYLNKDKGAFSPGQKVYYSLDGSNPITGGIEYDSANGIQVCKNDAKVKDKSLTLKIASKIDTGVSVTQAYTFYFEELNYLDAKPDLIPKNGSATTTQTDYMFYCYDGYDNKGNFTGIEVQLSSEDKKSTVEYAIDDNNYETYTEGSKIQLLNKSHITDSVDLNVKTKSSVDHNAENVMTYRYVLYKNENDVFARPEVSLDADAEKGTYKSEYTVKLAGVDKINVGNNDKSEAVKYSLDGGKTYTVYASDTGIRIGRSQADNNNKVTLNFQTQYYDRTIENSKEFTFKDLTIPVPLDKENNVCTENEQYSSFNVHFDLDSLREKNPTDTNYYYSTDNGAIWHEYVSSDTDILISFEQSNDVTLQVKAVCSEVENVKEYRYTLKNNDGVRIFISGKEYTGGVVAKTYANPEITFKTAESDLTIEYKNQKGEYEKYTSGDVWKPKYENGNPIEISVRLKNSSGRTVLERELTVTQVAIPTPVVSLYSNAEKDKEIVGNKVAINVDVPNLYADDVFDSGKAEIYYAKGVDEIKADPEFRLTGQRDLVDIDSATGEVYISVGVCVSGVWSEKTVFKQSVVSVPKIAIYSKDGSTKLGDSVTFFGEDVTVRVKDENNQSINVYYTTDKNDPTRQSDCALDGFISLRDLKKDTTLKVIAYNDVNIESSVVSLELKSKGTLSAPNASIPSGTYYRSTSGEQIYLSLGAGDTREDLEIRYTTDGSEPTSASMRYEDSDPIELTKTDETSDITYSVKAKVFTSDEFLEATKQSSETASFNFVIKDIPRPQLKEGQSSQTVRYNDFSIYFKTNAEESIRYKMNNSGDKKYSSWTNYDDSQGVEVKVSDAQLDEETGKKYVTVTAVTEVDDKINGGKMYGREATFRYEFGDIAPVTVDLDQNTTYYSERYVTLSCESDWDCILYHINDNGGTKKIMPDGDCRVWLSFEDVKDDNISITAWAQKNGEEGPENTYTFKLVEIGNVDIELSNAGGASTVDVMFKCPVEDSSKYDSTARVHYTINSGVIQELALNKKITLNWSEYVNANNTAKITAWIVCSGVSGPQTTKGYTFTNIKPPESSLDNNRIYYSQQNVKLTSEAPNSEIMYTLDGTAPKSEAVDSTQKYDATKGIDISIDDTPSHSGILTLNAITVVREDDKVYTSDTKTIKYSFGTITIPTVNYPQGSYCKYIQLKVTSDYVTDTNVDILYTTDGTDPTEQGRVYDKTNGIMLSQSIGKKIELKMVPRVDGNPKESCEFSGTYNFRDLSEPTASLETGVYYTPQNVTLNSTDNDEGIEIRYTIDDPNLTADSLKCSNGGSVYIDRKIGQTVTLRIMGVYLKENNVDWECSDIRTYEYTFKDIQSPVVTPPGGYYNTNPMEVYVTQSDMPGEVTYRYTTDGKDPTENSDKYSGKIKFSLTENEPVELKIRAFYEGETSAVTTAVYNYVENNWVYKNDTNKWMYIQNGQKVTNTLKKDVPGWTTSAFYFDADGYMVTGWYNYNGNWLYFEEDQSLSTYGSMRRGWLNTASSNPGRYYYLNEADNENGGVNMLGWIHTTSGNSYPGGCWYYMLSDESDPNGYLTGWACIDGYWYYFAPDWGGAMMCNTVVDGYRLDANGRLVN